MTPRNPAIGLIGLLSELDRVAVAVSGGVDSMTLATLADRMPGITVEIFHAVSPAVPPEATARVRRHADREDWALQVFDAGEFTDERYRSNPLDRCYVCKTHLYDAVSARTNDTVVSGTNIDDLGEYRPGLRAAAEHRVRHPFVEAGLDKPAVRELARELNLDDVAELPAAPCLASRVETGVVIDPGALVLVNRVERVLRARLTPLDVRCRVRSDRVAVELDAETLAGLGVSDQDAVAAWVGEEWQARTGHRPRVVIEAYRRGSAFVG